MSNSFDVPPSPGDFPHKYLVGGVGNDVFSSGGGQDSFDGGAGRDTVVFRGPMANYSITKIATSGISYTIKDKTGADGTDTITNIERLFFTDKKLAIDLDGNAGTVVKILGAVFGASSVSNKVYVGIGLSYLDAGMSYTDLMQLAIDARLGGRSSSADVVTLLYTNVVGSAPDAANLAYFKGLLDNGGMTQGSIGVLAADTSLNTTNVNLVGLAQTGIEFT